MLWDPLEPHRYPCVPASRFRGTWEQGGRVYPKLSTGYVYGFDEHTQITEEECEEWQLSETDIGGRVREPAEFAEMLLNLGQISSK